jgi:hypothetical protein
MGLKVKREKKPTALRRLAGTPSPAASRRPLPAGAPEGEVKNVFAR